ncbi:RNA DEMETHYLASE ALKBH9B [Salix viminalis]|uniref:RNA DEMETHYLASE ALKBH9B n=1 Tax=Salix viminalis TaxID=40686 RepID=A0A9Q0ZJJ1_SALVM|nr:RNA DEMETHYLASE ALKBH9B [Salix viminalis]
MTEINKSDNDDPFLAQYQPSDLKVASEFLSTWLPFISRDTCLDCTKTLSDRIRSLSELQGEDKSGDLPTLDINVESSNENRGSDGNCDNNSVGSLKEDDDTNSLGSWKDGISGWSELPVSEASISGVQSEGRSGMSWADMAQQDELVKEEEQEQQELNDRVVNVNDSTGGLRITKFVGKPAALPREKSECIRFMNVKRKKDFMCFEKVNGKVTNILQGLELHTGIFSAAEQKRIVDYVYTLQEKGKKGELKESTYSAPQKRMRGKECATLQFGCCYNYATDKHGNPPGIIKDEMVDPLPDHFKVIIRKLVQWHVIPPTCVPDSCIVNVFEEWDCIPPHVDNHDFVRPFCTVSFLSQCNILFGSNLRIVGAGDFDGPFTISLPVGSVLVINGNGADVAKHCVPSVPTKRISITFRKMDEAKRPAGFVLEPDLQEIQPLSFELDETRQLSTPKSELYVKRQPYGKEGMVEGRRYAENGSQPEPRYSSRNRWGVANQRRIRENMGRADG